MTRNIYSTIKARVTDVIDETPTIKTLVLSPEREIPFETGQFIELSIPKIGEAPFTPSSSPYKTETLEVTIMKVGYLTEKIHSLKIGDFVGIRGPYGKGYPIKKFYEKEVLIVGGGVGFAPLRSLIFALLGKIDNFKKIILCYGARTPEDIVYKYHFDEWKKIKKFDILRSVDRCPEGYKWDETIGVVTVLLDLVKVNIRESVAVVCGPPIMMKFTTLKLIEKGYAPENIYLSMERYMSCGLGKCGHCAIGPYFVCKDGPVFTYAQIKDQPEIWA